MTDQHFEKAVHSMSAVGRKGSPSEPTAQKKTPAKLGFVTNCKYLQLHPVGDTGTELPLVFSGNTALSNQSNAESDAVGAREALNDPDLLALIEAWPTLSEDIKLSISELLRTMN